MNNLFLKKDLAILIVDQVTDKITLQNVVSYYQFSSIFHLLNLVKMTADIIQRCFTSIAKTQNFLQLDFYFVNKILSSSQLCISSEVDVFLAANSWLSSDNFDRSKFVKNLILKTRFPLLCDNDSQYLFQKLSIPFDSSSNLMQDHLFWFFDSSSAYLDLV